MNIQEIKSYDECICALVIGWNSCELRARVVSAFKRLSDEELKASERSTIKIGVTAD